MTGILQQEPSLTTLWLIYGSVGLAGFFLCRLRYWAIYVVLPIVLLLSMPLLIELHDPVTGKAIRLESRPYYVQAHTVLAFAFLAPFLGARRKLREMGQ